MLKPAMNFLHQLIGDARGTSAIETAFVLPSVLMLAAGAVDLATAFSIKLHTQQAAARTIEFATTTGLEHLSLDDLRAEAAAAAAVPTTQVDVQRWMECDGARQELFEGSCESGQQIARYISVRIGNSYEPVLASFLPSRIRAQGTLTFGGFSSVRLQ